MAPPPSLSPTMSDDTLLVPKDFALWLAEFHENDAFFGADDQAFSHLSVVTNNLETALSLLLHILSNGALFHSNGA